MTTIKLAISNKCFISNNDEDSRTFSVIQSVKFDRVLNTFATDPVGHLGISPNAVLIGWNKDWRERAWKQ